MVSKCYLHLFAFYFILFYFNKLNTFMKLFF